MEGFKFIFWEAMKALSLALVALLASKAAGTLGAAAAPSAARSRLRLALYAAILALCGLGARAIGKDLAARFYYWASQDDLARSDVPRAYANALRAVELRPGTLGYWRALARSKFSQQQFQSMLEDRPAFEALSHGSLEEEDALRFAFADFFLAQYDRVIPVTAALIRENRFYAEPYVLQGSAYAAEGKYAEAERSFLDVLQMFPSQEDAVRGLAAVYFVSGKRAKALAVLGETEKFPFAPAARQRFRDLVTLYSQ
ncbi:MAG TPA: tetratricopeptide repeat protein [Terriglobia bacterium]|nr:tetratricopeptide repeat protein [Terriglobia bacterium]